MSRERESFQEKLKRWFTSGGAKAAPAPSHDIKMTETLKDDLKSSSPMPRRLHAIAELTEWLAVSKLEQNGMETLWCLVRDLLDLQVPPTCRRNTLRMLTVCAAGEPDMTYMRMVFIKYIERSHMDEEPEFLFNFFCAVVMDGRQVKYVEEEVGVLLGKWLPRLLGSRVKKNALQLAINLVKFHSSYFEDKLLAIYVKEAIAMMMAANDEMEAVLCLMLLETVTAYKYMPMEALNAALTALCRVVNVARLTDRVVLLVKNIVGTWVGSAAYNTLLELVDGDEEVQLVRGAMFFASYVTWGVTDVPTLQERKAELIRSLHYSMSIQRNMSRELLILYEVALSIRRLLSELEPGFTAESWSILVETVVTVYKNTSWLRPGEPRDKIMALLYNIMTLLDFFVDQGGYEGNIDNYYWLFDQLSYQRPVPAVIKAIDYWKIAASPPSRNWMPRLITLVRQYFLRDHRAPVNMKTLDVFKEIYVTNRSQFGRLMLKNVVLRLFWDVDRIRNLEVRAKAMQFLIGICRVEKCDEVMDVLRVVGGFITVKYRLRNPPELALENATDIITVVEGLLRIFRKRTWQVPSKIPVFAYNILLTFLESHYRVPRILHKVPQIRLEIFKMLFSMKCNDGNHLGFSHGELTGVEERNKGLIAPYSPYVMVSPLTHNSPHLQEAADGTDVTVMSVGDFGSLVHIAIRREREWPVLEFLFRELTQKLHEKTIVLAFLGYKMDRLTATLCKLACDTSLKYPRCTINAPPAFSRSEFESRVYPVLARLVAHHRHLAPITQQQLIQSLQHGVINRYCSQLCVETITLCVMELPQAMGKHIAMIIRHFSRITQSVNNSQAMLEFLSTLLHFPEMYRSFVVPQYMSVFAIAIPYTNPFKFNHYIVSLAFHVIAMWFLKCNLSFRIHVVRYITRNLKQKLENMHAAYLQKGSPGKLRKASRKEKEKEKEKRDERQKNEMNIQVYTELMEVCIDLMSRYVFTYYKPETERSGRMETLVVEGKSQTWVVGHKLITIATSGCTGKPVQANRCAVCLRLCSKGAPPMQKVDMDRIYRSNELDQPDQKGTTPIKIVAKFTPPPASSSSSLPTPLASKTSPSAHSQKHSTNLPSPTSPSIQSSPQKVTPSSPSAPPTSKALLSLPLTASSPSDQPSQSAQSAKSPLQSLPSPPPSKSSPSTPTKPFPSPPPAQLSPSQPKSTKASPPSSSATLSVRPKVFPQSVQSPTSPPPTLSPSSPFPSPPPAQFSPSHPKSTKTLASPSSSATLSVRPKVFPQSVQSPKSPPPTLSPSTPTTPTTPQSPNFPFAAFPQLSPTSPGLSSPDVSFALPLSELSKEFSESSPDKEMFQKTPSPQAASRALQGEGQLLSKDNLHLPQAAEKGSPGHSVGPQDTEVRRRDRVREPHQGLPPVPEDVGVGEDPVYQGAAPISHTFPRCICWCNHWAELSINQPCGSFSAAVRIEGSQLMHAEDRHFLRLLRKDSEHLMLGASGGSVEAVQGEDGNRESEASASSHPRTSPALEASAAAAKRATAEMPIMSPSFVFLQLYYQNLMPTDDTRPILLPTEQENTQRTISLLDLIRPLDTHKIGVLYLRRGQTQEREILGNTFGSSRYLTFLSALGSYVELRKVSRHVFVGGLDTSGSGSDGDNTILWTDDLMQVAFHVATMMPTKKTDAYCNNKKRHIGNNFVTIVFNESGQPYNPDTITCQFNHVVIEIVPHHKETNTVKIHYKPDMMIYLRSSTPRLVSNRSLPLLVRQAAVHSDLAAKIMEAAKRTPNWLYTNNWVQRLRHIRKIHGNALAGIRRSEERFGIPELNDFSDLTDVTVRNRELSKSGQYSIQLMY